MVTMTMTVIVASLAIVALMASAMPHALTRAVTTPLAPTMDGASPWL